MEFFANGPNCFTCVIWHLHSFLPDNVPNFECFLLLIKVNFYMLLRRGVHKYFTTVLRSFLNSAVIVIIIIIINFMFILEIVSNFIKINWNELVKNVKLASQFQLRSPLWSTLKRIAPLTFHVYEICHAHEFPLEPFFCKRGWLPQSKVTHK